MVKQDIRKVYAAADSGDAPAAGTDGIIHKDRYQIVFNLNGGNPPNCYSIWKSSWTGSAYGPMTREPLDKLTANRIARDTNGNKYIQPSASSDIRITNVTGAAGNQITFVPSGSIIQTTATGDSTVTIHSQSQNKDIVINVSMFGSVE